MKTGAISKTPPAGVSRDVMWGELRRLQGKAQGAAKFTNDFVHVAIGGGVSIGSGILLTKFPMLAKIPKTNIDIPLVLGGLVLAWGLYDKKAGDTAFAIASGLLYPWLYMKGEELGEKIAA